jgi:hypothetical protein
LAARLCCHCSRSQRLHHDSTQLKMTMTFD